jgi:hypothetical protein
LGRGWTSHGGRHLGSPWGRERQDERWRSLELLDINNKRLPGRGGLSRDGARTWDSAQGCQ